MKLSLHSVLVFAPDLAVAREFYGTTLGLALVQEQDGYLQFQGSNFRLTVFSCAEATSPEGYSAKAGSSVVLAVDDLEEGISRLGARGVRLLHAEPQEGPHGRYVAFADPFGTVHELFEPRR